MCWHALHPVRPNVISPQRLLQREEMEDRTGKEVCKTSEQVQSGCGGAGACPPQGGAAHPQEARCLDCQRGANLLQHVSDTMAPLDLLMIGLPYKWNFRTASTDI